MNIACGVLPRRRPQRLDQSDDGIADDERARRDLGQGHAVDRGGGADRLGSLRRDDAEARLGARQGRLDVEHALQPLAVREEDAHGLAAEQAAEDGGIGGIDRHAASRSCRSISSRSKSDLEEGGLALALQDNVEAVGGDRAG